ncbi:MAG TPA: thioesterase family protein [Syntrophales bacterium]|nr:thioesterase family protein [Syntrophales bacterium]HPX56057.1 thioesterase family protein [Syntrophales bacterium]
MLCNQTKIRVIYADTDAMGIVYHTNYIKWFEIGRGELFRQMDMTYAWVEEQGYGMPLTEVYAHYLSPAQYDQLLLVETEIGYVKRASIRFNYTIWDEFREKALVEGHSVHAFVDQSRRIVRIPSFITDRIKQLEQTGGSHGG